MRDRTGAARWRMAVCMVVLALALAGCGGQAQKAAATATTAAPTATLTPVPTSPPNNWTAVTDLNSVASFAPAQLRTQFQTFSGQTSKTTPPELWVRRSDDFGKTYHDVSLPPIPGGATATNVTYLTGEPSPANPGVYYLTAQTQGTCGGTACQYQYVTMDGGATWRLLSLPVHGILGVVNASGAKTQAQGQRLYGLVTDAVLASSGVVPPGRLVVSNDGGATWALADSAIFAASQWVYNYAATPGGSTVFALTGPTNANEPEYAPPISIWRSADAGATWTKAGPLPGKYALGVQAAISATTGKPVLYALVSDASNDYHLDASSDGGATWPATYVFHSGRELNSPHDFPSLIGTLADGAVAIASYDYSTLGWAPGYTLPHYLLPAPPNVGFIQAEILTPSNGLGVFSLWIVSQDSQGKLTYYYSSAQ